MKKILCGNLELILGFICGLLISGFAVYAATTVASSAVTYSTTNSSANGATKTNVQGALDELYSKSNSCDFFKNVSIKKVLSYNEKSGSNISKDSTFKCVFSSTKTFDYDGFFIVEILGIHGGATSNSDYSDATIGSYTTTATLVKYIPDFMRQTYNGYEDLKTNVYIFKVKKNDTFAQATCKLTGHSGRVYINNYEIRK